MWSKGGTWSWGIRPVWDAGWVYCVVLAQNKLCKICVDSTLILTSNFHLPSLRTFTSPQYKCVLLHMLSISGSCFPSWSLQMYEKQESWNQDVHYRPWKSLLSFLSGWWISERFVDFGYFHFCLLDSTNLGLILILSKKMAKFPLTSKETAWALKYFKEQFKTNKAKMDKNCIFSLY